MKLRDTLLEEHSKKQTLKIVEYISGSNKRFGEQMGLAADLCFPLIGDQTEPSAVRAYAVTICHRICKHEPALASELKLILEDCYASSPAAVQSRAKKILKELNQRNSK